MHYQNGSEICKWCNVLVQKTGMRTIKTEEPKHNKETSLFPYTQSKCDQTVK